MKRMVTFSVEADGRKRIQSISIPVDEAKAEDLSENVGFIDASYVDPTPIPGKELRLYYNDSAHIVEFEYSDIEFDDLDPLSKIDQLKAENARLKADNELTQEALMELYELMVGGEN